MAKAIAYKTRFAAPYRIVGGREVVNLPTCPRCAQTGVYFIKSNRTGKVIYIGYSSSNLYKTITRHFQTWNDKQQDRFVYSKNGYTVRVIFTSMNRAAILEKYLITKYKPRDNKMKYDSYLSASEEKQAANIEAKAEFISVHDDVPF